jgi:hypothetical protein
MWLINGTSSRPGFGVSDIETPGYIVTRGRFGASRFSKRGE